MKQFVLAAAIVALIMRGGLLTETTYSDYEDFAGVSPLTIELGEPHETGQ